MAKNSKVVKGAKTLKVHAKITKGESDKYKHFSEKLVTNGEMAVGDLGFLFNATSNLSPTYVAVSFESYIEHLCKLNYLTEDELIVVASVDIDKTDESQSRLVLQKNYVTNKVYGVRELETKMLDELGKTKVDVYKKLMSEGKKYIFIDENGEDIIEDYNQIYDSILSEIAEVKTDKVTGIEYVVGYVETTEFRMATPRDKSGEYKGMEMLRVITLMALADSMKLNDKLHHVTL